MAHFVAQGLRAATGWDRGHRGDCVRSWSDIMLSGLPTQHLYLEGAVLDCNSQAAGGRQGPDVGGNGAVEVCSTMPHASGLADAFKSAVPVLMRPSGGVHDK